MRYFPGIVVTSLLLLAAPANAACYTAQQQLPQSAIDAVVANPSRLFADYPNRGALIVRIRDLVASDPAAFKAIMSVIPSATADQKSAIGAAMAQAAKLCLKNDPAFATTIQQSIAESKDESVTLAYVAAAGDVPTAAVGAGAAGSSGANGGQVTPFASNGLTGGGFEAFGNHGINTPLFSYTSSVSGGGGSFTTTTIIVSGSISP